MKKDYLFVLFTFILLASCGGGGGSTPPAAPPASSGLGGEAQGYQVQEKIQAVD
tara:strand:- start:649 stop:810 length:162 start_codon:yes stop_codon:yes gene_type:complete